ncbi:hypothetical protein ACQPYK_04210 [Streptosporangium sp. CA-135522]|uniref:hypothetical protein n=1 Tax=Streptosporangium sp. CA-135522 TaxID=3240072 RepID=UPI003D93E4F7
MSEHLPYTIASVSLDEDGTRLSISFNTPEVLVTALGAQRERPFLSLSTTEANVTITTTGSGPVTERDVTLARKIADAAARYLADCEQLHAAQAATPMLPGLDEDAA